MQWIIGADICPTKCNLDLFLHNNTSALIGEELKNILSAADFTVFNLEVPISDQPDPIDKCGPCLIAPTKVMHAIKTINPYFFTLANNHILDHNVSAMHSTMALLEQNGIAFAGVGDTPKDAAKPFVFEKDGMRIGIYCCAEHEFSIVTEEHAGANPFDLLDSPDHIAALKKQCDFVIVLYHGGKEHYRYPSPRLQKVCRKCIEKGADLVICQHTHCIGCEEEYQNGRIIYGQGNFLFVKENIDEFWDTALLLSCDFECGKPIKVDYLPICKANNAIRLASGQKKEEILQGFYNRSEEIKDPSFIRKAYSDFSLKNIEFYLSRISGKTETLDIEPSRLLSCINYYECEPHMELILEAFKTLAKKNKK